ncbi:hypothetical protein [Haloterrigena salifodinae]|uniref:hypothetical protein n=1 Tax=Haloterrigena salifodinae TaxID=2675099 RepID=UPI000F87CE35|nr:hypothetical protein [Haloterrigena salifodinae]
MNWNPSRDRYNYEHRSDSAFQVGESMPGTVGDSKGTVHDRQGDQPAIDLNKVEKVSVPGGKAKHKVKAEETESPSDLLGECLSVKIEGKQNGTPYAVCNDHQILVPNSTVGNTVMVTVKEQNGQLTGQKFQLKL